MLTIFIRLSPAGHFRCHSSGAPALTGVCKLFRTIAKLNYSHPNSKGSGTPVSAAQILQRIPRWPWPVQTLQGTLSHAAACSQFWKLKLAKYTVLYLLTVSTRAADAWCPPCCSPCSSRAWWGRGSSTSSTSSWWSSVSTPVPGYPSLAPAAGYCPWTRLPTGCYQYFQDQQNWTAAQHLCRTRGGRLAELEGETRATWPLLC